MTPKDKIIIGIVVVVAVIVIIVVGGFLLYHYVIKPRTNNATPTPATKLPTPSGDLIPIVGPGIDSTNGTTAYSPVLTSCTAPLWVHFGYRAHNHSDSSDLDASNVRWDSIAYKLLDAGAPPPQTRWGFKLQVPTQSASALQGSEDLVFELYRKYGTSESAARLAPASSAQASVSTYDRFAGGDGVLTEQVSTKPPASAGCLPTS